MLSIPLNLYKRTFCQFSKMFDMNIPSIPINGPMKLVNYHYNKSFKGNIPPIIFNVQKGKH